MGPAPGWRSAPAARKYGLEAVAIEPVAGAGTDPIHARQPVGIRMALLTTLSGYSGTVELTLPSKNIGPMGPIPPIPYFQNLL